MTTIAPSTEQLAPILPATLRLGPTHLTISNLDGSIAFYERALGLQLRRRDGHTAYLGAGGEDLVVLVEERDAALGGRHAGLYHFALLFDTREELARAIVRLAETRTRIEGASDHGVSEAVYLRDPDDNGIELYVDRPRSQWPAPRQPGERVAMYTIALDMQALLRSVQGEQPQELAGPGLRTGHLHLHVANMDRGLAFYRDVLGFEVMVNLGSAAFVSAGGYHHHLGFNVWLGSDVTPKPPHTAGLRHWTLLLASASEVAEVRARVEAAGLDAQPRDGGFLVRDPWQTAVVITVAPAPDAAAR
ncbi:MAG TPA: VOC family protein [Solirubrobacteraceae bacterium]|jgi:catechol 2,3-dioxygenase|nr:VOC family protein [Solirubrobacteraceae bacterium]